MTPLQIKGVTFSKNSNTRWNVPDKINNRHCGRLRYMLISQPD